MQVTVAVAVMADTAYVTKKLYHGVVRAVQRANLTNDNGFGFKPVPSPAVDWSCRKSILETSGPNGNHPFDSCGYLVPSDDGTRKLVFEAISKEHDSLVQLGEWPGLCCGSKFVGLLLVGQPRC